MEDFKFFQYFLLIVICVLFGHQAKEFRNKRKSKNDQDKEEYS